MTVNGKKFCSKNNIEFNTKLWYSYINMFVEYLIYVINMEIVSIKSEYIEIVLIKYMLIKFIMIFR